jgi:glycerol-3-phosphate acyltransferase PlsY
MADTLYIILILLASYLLGSLPTAVIFSRLFFGFDIRDKGSGNMGSTNSFRVLGWKWGVAVQVIDILKGYASVILIAGIFGAGISIPNATFFDDITLIKIAAGVASVLGHIWPVFVKFKGGKGVNTATGVLIGLIPYDVAIAAALFIIAVIFSGYISLGSIVAAFTVPSSLAVRYNLFGSNIEGYQMLLIFTIVVSSIVLYTHRANIKRLLAGNENKFNKLHLIKLKSNKSENKDGQ